MRSRNDLSPPLLTIQRRRRRARRTKRVRERAISLSKRENPEAIQRGKGGAGSSPERRGPGTKGSRKENSETALKRRALSCSSQRRVGRNTHPKAIARKKKNQAPIGAKNRGLNLRLE
jgi:hypothetical protein